MGQDCMKQPTSWVWWLQWLSVGLVIERLLVRLPAGALSSQLGQLSLPSLRCR